MARRTTEERLVALLTARLEKFLGGPPRDLSLFHGRRHRRDDTMAWAGTFYQPGLNAMETIGSWDTMTECLREGMQIDDRRGQRRWTTRFEVHSLPHVERRYRVIWLCEMTCLACGLGTYGPGYTGERYSRVLPCDRCGDSPPSCIDRGDFRERVAVRCRSTSQKGLPS